MCGRYRLSRRKQILEEHFSTVSWDEDWAPRYNIAPTQPVPILRQNSKEPVREISLVRWGLIPSWSKDSSASAKMINARLETAARLPAFRDAMKSRRCIIPADGFYEWQKKGNAKQPYCFEVGDGNLFAFAGIWDRWKDPCGIPGNTRAVLRKNTRNISPLVTAKLWRRCWLLERPLRAMDKILFDPDYERECRDFTGT